MFPPLVADFKAQFNREFVYGTALNQVQDNDIQQAINMAGINFNQALFDGVTPVGSTTELNIVYLYAAAFFLALKVQSAGGLSAVNRGRGVKSSGGGVIETKAIGGVSLSYAIPERIKSDPILSQFMRNDFGQIYLLFLAPFMVGNVGLVSGVGGGVIGPVFGLLNTQPLMINTVACTNGTHNVAYTQAINATGGVGQYTWTIASGSLPTGLTLGSLTGIISGTPTVAGTYYFEVRCTDIMGHAVTMNYQVVIA